MPRGPIVVPFWDYLISLGFRVYRILQKKPKKELLWGFWVDRNREAGVSDFGGFGFQGIDFRIWGVKS